MIFPSNRVRILVATKPIDFRKGHDSLAAVVKNELRKDPFTGTVFVFRAKKAACSASTILSLTVNHLGRFWRRRVGLFLGFLAQFSLLLWLSLLVVAGVSARALLLAVAAR